MNEEEVLDQYFAICQRIYEEMERDGTWPWESESTKQEDLLESKDNSQQT